MDRFRVIALVVVAALARVAAADGDAKPADASLPDEDTPPLRRREATIGTIFRGPFRSSRLFAMPTADVVGAYMLSLSGDGSLLQQPGILTSAGVIAIGFGDISQLEYRHTAAISVTGVNAPVPAVGAQLKIPIPEHSGVPAFGIALRLGVPRRETFGMTDVAETVTDLYLVARERFDGVPWLRLHAGARISSAKIVLTGATAFGPVKRTMVLPTLGVELAMNREAKLVAEVAAAPQFRWQGAMVPGSTDDPTIGYGMLGRLGLRWKLVPSVIFDGTLGYQMEVDSAAPSDGPRDVVHQWDIRLGAEVFVPWGALACRATGTFCD